MKPHAISGLIVTVIPVRAAFIGITLGGIFLFLPPLHT